MIGAAGMWGEYCEREGHGKFVDLQRKEVVLVRDGSMGPIKVPDAECIAVYIMVMAIGNTNARWKGDTADYRQAWHHAQQPTQLYMKARRQSRCICGHADPLPL